MGGKLKQPLTPAQKRKRRLPLMRHEDRQRSLWLLVGAIEVALLFMLFKTIGL